MRNGTSGRSKKPSLPLKHLVERAWLPGGQTLASCRDLCHEADQFAGLLQNGFRRRLEQDRGQDPHEGLTRLKRSLLFRDDSPCPETEATAVKDTRISGRAPSAFIER